MTEQPGNAEQFAAAVEELFAQLDTPLEPTEDTSPDQLDDLMADIAADTNNEK